MNQITKKQFKTTKTLELAIEKRVGEKEFDWFVDKACNLNPELYIKALTVIYAMILRAKTKKEQVLCLQIVTLNIMQGKFK